MKLTIGVQSTIIKEMVKVSLMMVVTNTKENGLTTYLMVEESKLFQMEICMKGSLYKVIKRVKVHTNGKLDNM